MGGGDSTSNKKKKSDVIIPDLGAAKYWYVDPRVVGQQYNPMSVNQDMLELLKRIGISDQSRPSF